MAYAQIQQKLHKGDRIIINIGAKVVFGYKRLELFVNMDVLFWRTEPDLKLIAQVKIPERPVVGLALATIAVAFATGYCPVAQAVCCDRKSVAEAADIRHQRYQPSDWRAFRGKLGKRAARYGQLLIFRKIAAKPCVKIISHRFLRKHVRKIIVCGIGHIAPEKQASFDDRNDVFKAVTLRCSRTGMVLLARGFALDSKAIAVSFGRRACFASRSCLRRINNFRIHNVNLFFFTSDNNRLLCARLGCECAAYQFL